jgi:hypothetical protein
MRTPQEALSEGVNAYMPQLTCKHGQWSIREKHETSQNPHTKRWTLPCYYFGIHPKCVKSEWARMTCKSLNAIAHVLAQYMRPCSGLIAMTFLQTKEATSSATATTAAVTSSNVALTSRQGRPCLPELGGQRFSLQSW